MRLNIAKDTNGSLRSQTFLHIVQNYFLTNIRSKNNVNTKPYNIRAKITANTTLSEPSASSGRPTKIDVWLKNLYKCHASVVNTNMVDEPGKRYVFQSSAHLFFHDSFGFQNNCLYLMASENILFM